MKLRKKNESLFLTEKYIGQLDKKDHKGIVYSTTFSIKLPIGLII